MNSGISAVTAGGVIASPDVAVVILTFNEEENLPQTLRSVVGWAREVFVLDSCSTDRTVAIAKEFGCTAAQNRFENFGRQRNYALDHLPISAEWVFFLDADEWLPEDLKREIGETVARGPAENGFYVKRRLIWMGKWIRRGYYPTWILRLFRRGKARCEDRDVNEHIVLDGSVGHLKNDFMHEDRKGISEWIVKHVRYAEKEAALLLEQEQQKQRRQLPGRLFGCQVERKRWLRTRLWNRLPPLIRPFFYFFYRYILRLGVLDGRAAFVYHFLQALWLPLLIDVKYLELKKRARLGGSDISGAS